MPLPASPSSEGSKGDPIIFPIFSPEKKSSQMGTILEGSVVGGLTPGRMLTAEEIAKSFSQPDSIRCLILGEFDVSTATGKGAPEGCFFG